MDRHQDEVTDKKVIEVAPLERQDRFYIEMEINGQPGHVKAETEHRAKVIIDGARNYDNLTPPAKEGFCGIIGLDIPTMDQHKVKFVRVLRTTYIMMTEEVDADGLHRDECNECTEEDCPAHPSNGGTAKQADFKAQVADALDHMTHEA